MTAKVLICKSSIFRKNDLKQKKLWLSSRRPSKPVTLVKFMVTTHEKLGSNTLAGEKIVVIKV